MLTRLARPTDTDIEISIDGGKTWPPAATIFYFTTESETRPVGDGCAASNHHSSLSIALPSSHLISNISLSTCLSVIFRRALAHALGGGYGQWRIQRPGLLKLAKKRKKSTLAHSTIAKVWFFSLNYKIGYPASSNYRNRLFYLPWRFYKWFFTFFS